MAGETKSAAEVLGVRLWVWAAVPVAIVGVTLFWDEPQPTRSVPAAQSRRIADGRQAIPVSPPRPDAAEITANASRAQMNFFEARENEPTAVLLNELFSPDPEARIAAATLLSRKSLYASDAVPVLKRAVRDEQDPKVREVMKEAIINIRGYVPPPFMFDVQRKR